SALAWSRACGACKPPGAAVPCPPSSACQGGASRSWACLASSSLRVLASACAGVMRRLAALRAVLRAGAFFAAAFLATVFFAVFFAAALRGATFLAVFLVVFLAVFFAAFFALVAMPASVVATIR